MMETNENDRGFIVMRIEPSKRLSELCRYPYFIEKKFKVEKLLKAGIITEGDIDRMKEGAKISAKIKVEVRNNVP
jgi:hypothetical protein